MVKKPYYGKIVQYSRRMQIKGLGEQVKNEKIFKKGLDNKINICGNKNIVL